MNIYIKKVFTFLIFAVVAFESSARDGQKGFLVLGNEGDIAHFAITFPPPGDGKVGSPDPEECRAEVTMTIRNGSHLLTVRDKVDATLTRDATTLITANMSDPSIQTPYPTLQWHSFNEKGPPFGNSLILLILL